MFHLSKSSNLNLAKLYSGAENLYNELPAVKKYRRRRTVLRIFKVLFFIILSFLVFMVVVFGAHYLALKQVYNGAIKGKGHLEQAIVSAKNQDFKQAIVFSNQATTELDGSLLSLGEIKNSFLISHLPVIFAQFDDLNYLLNSVEILSRSVGQASTFGDELRSLLDGNKKLTYSTLSSEEKRRILGRIYQSAPELVGMKANLDLALINLNKINSFGLLWPISGKIADIKVQVEDASFILGKAAPMSQILPALAGYPNKSTYLLLLENSDELRPTGGFIGTYGILQMENGDIARLDTHDIYHLDMPVQDKVSIIPPEPIKNYLNPKWYMRDANWSPDWPTSAQKVEWFYKIENDLLTGKDQINNFNGQFDGVIAITPKLVTSLISMVGPIVVDGQEYNENNFTDLLEYRVEKGYVQLGVSSWQRKEVIGQILKEIKIRLLNLPADRWQTVVNIFDNNVLKKNLLVYLNDENHEQLIADQKWTGELSNTTDDFLMLVDANMAALKTDSVMNRNVNYQVQETSNGLTAKVTINYAHRGKVDWKTSRYQTYSRIYVPLGSKLINSTGFSGKGVEVQEDLKKTVFGYYLTVDPGTISQVTLEYQLPNQLKEKILAGQYNLLVQKQPGNEVTDLSVGLNLINPLKSYQPVGFSVDRYTGNQISWSTDLEMDKSFNVSL